MTDRQKYNICIIVLLAMAILMIAFFGEGREYLGRMQTLEEELEKQTQLAEEEYQQLRNQQIELIEENKRLRKELERYKKLDNYVRSSFESANPGISSGETEELTGLFWQQVKEYEFEPEKAIAWVQQESEFKVTAISRKGALGLTQVMPKTGQEVCRKLGIEWKGRETLLNPKNNLVIGFYYLNWCKERPAVITEHQIYTAYFWGIGNVKKMHLDETTYSKEILERAKDLGRVQNV